MVFYNFIYKNRLLVTILLFITIVNITSLCFADEGDFNVVNNLFIQTVDSSTATFVSTTDTINVYYTYLKKGHSYRVTFNRDFWESNVQSGSTLLYILNSSEIPSNGVYANIVDKLTMTYTDDEISVDFLVREDSYYYFCVSARGNFSNRFSLDNFTLEDVSTGVGQIDSVQSLVNNVGPNALWGVFGSGIDFVFIIVVVALGLFIIFKLFKGLSKGKSKI